MEVLDGRKRKERNGNGNTLCGIFAAYICIYGYAAYVDRRKRKLISVPRRIIDGDLSRWDMSPYYYMIEQELLISA